MLKPTVALPSPVCAAAVEFSAQGMAQRFDPQGLQMGEVGQDAFADLLALAQGFSQQDSGRGIAIGDDIDVMDTYLAQ